VAGRRYAPHAALVTAVGSDRAALKRPVIAVGVILHSRLAELRSTPPEPDPHVEEHHDGRGIVRAAGETAGFDSLVMLIGGTRALVAIQARQ
jgi:hypothetical protein